MHGEARFLVYEMMDNGYGLLDFHWHVNWVHQENYVKTPTVAAIFLTIALILSSFSQAGFLLNMQGCRGGSFSFMAKKSSFSACGQGSDVSIEVDDVEHDDEMRQPRVIVVKTRMV